MDGGNATAGRPDTDERPFVLIWELTQACELACKHCRAEAEPERHPGELTTAEAKAFLEDCREFAEDQLVVFSGGDPLARDDAVDLVEYGTDLGLRVTMTPSGTASLDAGAIEDLADAGLRRMALSLDGASAAAHDGFRKEAGSFASTVRAARATRRAGLPLQINTTVCAETVGELPALAELVEDLGAVLWSVFFLVPVGRGRALEPISPEHAESVMEWLLTASEERSFGVKTTEAPHYRRVALQNSRGESPTSARGDLPTGAQRDSPTGDRGDPPTGTREDASAAAREGAPAGADHDDDGDQGSTPDRDRIGRNAGITAGDGFAFVSHLGDVYPSGFLPESAGNVREESVVDIYRDADLFADLRDPDALRGKCGACPYRRVCGGSRSRAYAYTGDPLESDPLCAYVPEGYEGSLPEQRLPPIGSG
ncbi:MAG: radical SAM protein [Halobacteriales archaeon]